MIDVETIRLLIELTETNSPGIRLSLIERYCLLNADMTTQRDLITDLLEKYENQVYLKSQQGKKAFHKIKAKNKKKYKKPGLFYSNDYNAKQRCISCGETICSNRAFRLSLVRGYEDFHAIPDCFPDDQFSDASHNRYYLKDMEIKK
jgi:hypothetical protein